VSNAFVPLVDFLRPVERSSREESAAPQPVEPSRASGPSDCDEALRAARRFRAALDDALEAAREELLRRIAHDVLARELMLAPADVRAIVEAARKRLQAESVLTIHVHPSDLEVLDGIELDVQADRGLEPGDVRVQVRSGTIDLALAARLDAALCAFGRT
jgi:flagellar biosynthesis/type III secretory pathway protein FliH